MDSNEKFILHLWDSNKITFDERQVLESWNLELKKLQENSISENMKLYQIFGGSCDGCTGQVLDEEESDNE